MKKFALIGAAGYVAPRHLVAIAATGNHLLAALDKSDSVGVLDQYFPNTAFFTEFERFDRHLEKLKRADSSIDYLSVCSPNYLHDAHIRYGLRNGIDVICEKPIVLNPWNLQALIELEKDTGNKVYSILQLRLHPSVIALKKKVESANRTEKWDITLEYLTSRGNWYYASWKGDETKSGGIATNIGVHFFDMLGWIFGDLITNEVHLHTHDRAAGFLEFEKARVKWFLSINYDLLPEEVKAAGQRTFRSLTIDEEAFEFSDGFTDLHTLSYQHILNNDGFRLKDTLQAIQIVEKIRTQEPLGLNGRHHSLAERALTKHPFNRH